MNKHRSTSLWQMAQERFWRNRWATTCVIVLILFYTLALFADFVAPYGLRDESRGFSYAPPTPIHFMHDGKWRGPFVYGQTLVYDSDHRRVYTSDKSKIFKVSFGGKGKTYKLFNMLPSARHLFSIEEGGRIYLLGADERGRDIFSRIVHGSRISLSVGIIGVAISFILGLIVGGIAGYYGGIVDNILMRICEIFMMVPGFYLLLAFRAAVPDNISSVQLYFAIVVILSIIGWSSLARVIRGMCLSLRQRDYVVAAKMFGLTDWQIIVKHILPHTMSYCIFALMLSIPGYILGESALSLIGLGIQDPYASWGNMLSEGMSVVRIYFAPWILWPGVFIFITIICFNVIGDTLRDCLDPLLKGEETIHE